MDAPDKKYPLSIVGDLLASTPPNEVVFNPDKIYFDGVDTSTTPRLAINEEYIRKDALLEWLKEQLEVAGSKDDHDYDVYAAGEYNAYDEVINKINSM